MKTLQQLTVERERATNLASMDEAALPVATQGAWRTAINEAKVRAVELEAEYLEVVKQTGLAACVAGPIAQLKALYEMVNDMGGLTIDGDSLYRQIATTIEETLGHSRQWGVAQTHRLHLALQEAMHSTGLRSIHTPKTDTFPVLPDYQATETYVKSLIPKELVAQYIERQVALAAWSIRYNKDIVPAIILGLTDGDVVSGFGKGAVFLEVKEEDEINEAYVTELVKQIKEKNENADNTKLKKGKRKQNGI